MMKGNTEAGGLLIVLFAIVRETFVEGGGSFGSPIETEPVVPGPAKPEPKNDYRDDIQLIDNFFGDTGGSKIDRQFGKIPTREEIHDCINSANLTRLQNAEIPLRSQAEFDFRKWEIDVLPNIYETVNVRGRGFGTGRVSRLWSGGRIPFVFDKNFGFTSPERCNIIVAMNNIHKKTCIRFQIKLETDKTFINLIKDGECATCLGKCIHGVYQCKGGCFYDSKKRVMRHLVYLNWCAPFVSAIMHELLHVIGLEHEQKRIDRPYHITANTSGLGSAVKAQFKVDRSLNLQKTPLVTNVATALNGLMHYSSRMEKNGKWRGMGCTLGQVFYRDSMPSVLDIQEINSMYRCPDYEQLGGCADYFKDQCDRSQYIWEEFRGCDNGGESKQINNGGLDCRDYKDRGYCSSKEWFMGKYCRKTCNFCN